MENTIIPLSFDVSALQGQLDDITKIMNKTFASFGSKGQFKSLSTAMNSFKGSFGTINKSLKSIDSNLGLLVININKMSSSLQETGKEMSTLRQGTKDSIVTTEKLVGGFSKVQSEVKETQSLLKKPMSLNIDLGKTDLVGPLEKQLSTAQQKINQAYKFETPIGKKAISFVDETKVKNDVKVFENAYSEIKNSSDAMITYVRGTTRDILKHPMNSLEQFQNLWTRTIYNLQSHKTGREAIPLFTLTGSELGPISAAIEKLAEFRKVRRGLDVESLKSFESRPFEELAKSLSKSGFAYDELIEAARAFNVLEVTGEKHIDANIKQTKEYKVLEKAIKLYSEAVAVADRQMEKSGTVSDGQVTKVKKLKLAMDEARKSVSLKGEIVSVNALAGTLENLGDVAGTKVTAAFHKLASSSKKIGKETWAKVFEAKDIGGFQKALVVLESKLGQVGKSNPQIEALYKNFSNIKQIAETHFAAKMSAEFEEGASKSEKKIGELYTKITKLQSQVAKGELPQSALVGPFKALSKEVESLIKRSQVLNVSLDQIEQSKGPSAMRYEKGPKSSSTESRDLATTYQEGVSEKQISSLSTLQSGLRGVADQLIYANTELKVSEAAWVSWGEARKKIVFDLRKITSEFEVPVEDVSRTDISKKHRQYADYQKQIDSLVKKRKLLGMVDKSSYSESLSQMKKVLSGLPQLNDLQKRGNQIVRERKALLDATAGKEKTPEQIAHLEKLKKQYKEVKTAETEVANVTLLIANEMDVLASKSAFNPTDIARISEFAIELQRIDSLIKTISGKSSLSISADVETLQRSLGTISKDAIPIKTKITIDQKAIDKEIATLGQKFHAAMAKEPKIRTETRTKTALQTIRSTQNAIGKLDKQLFAMTDSANVALRNIRMDKALNPKDAEQLMKPLQNLVSEFSGLQKDILLIDESLTKLGSNPTEEQMQKAWSQLEPVFSNAYEKMNLFSGVYDNLSKKQGGATAATNNMVSSLERLMQKPTRAAKSFDILIDSLLRTQGIAGKTDLAKQLKSPDKAIREYAQKISASIGKARTGLDTIAGEALGPEANKKIKQNIKRAEENYVKQVADAQKRARRKLDSLIKKAEAGPGLKRSGAIDSAKAAFGKEIGASIISAKKSLEQEKERILNVPVKLKPGVEADLVLKKWKSTIQALVTDFGQGGNLAAQKFQEMYASTAGGFKFDQSLYNVASKTKSLLGQTGSFFKTMGSRSGDVLPLEEFDQLIKRQKQFQKEGALSTVALNPIIELGSVISNTANVFDKMKLAVKASASPEVIDSIQKEIDQFIRLRKTSKDSTAQLSQQTKETRGLGFTMEKFGYAIDLLIQYLEKAINKFQGLGKTAHTALSGIGSSLRGQAGLFKSGLADIEGPMFDIKPEGFKLTKPLESMFSEIYNSSLTSLQDLRKVTDKGLSAWSVSFKGGLSKTDNVIKQNGSALIGGLSKIRKSVQASTVVNWGNIIDPKGAELLRKSAVGIDLQLKELQTSIARFKTGKISEVSSFPTVKALQTQLKTVLSVSEEVKRKLAAGKLGMEHFPAVDKLQQYALQLTAAIDMIEKPYKSMKGLAGQEEKVSTKQLGKSFRSGIIGAQKELEAAVKQVKTPMKSVMVRLFEDVLSMTPTEIPQAAGMMRSLAEQFPSQMQSAFNVMGKKKYEVGKFIAKMFSIDPSEFKTVEAAMEKRGAEIPKMLLKAIFLTEGQAKFAADAKKLANQVITAPLNKALRSAGEVTMPKFETFRIGDEMMRAAKFEGEKFTQVKSQYGTYISSLINDISKLMKVSPSKTMKPILEKIFNASDVNDINAYANGMKGALSNIKDYLQKAVSGKLPKGQLAAGLGLQEEFKVAGLDIDENELSQMFEQMYKTAGQSLKDFVAQEKRWSSDSIKDLIILMEYWENLGGMVDMVTKKIPKVSNMKNISETMFKGTESGSVAAGRDMARLMVTALTSTLSEGSGIKQPLAAMIGKSPEVIFEIMRGTNQKLKNELRDLGFNLRGSTTDLVKSISKLGDVKVGTEWFEQYRLANERFNIEGEKTGIVLKKIRDGFNTITPLSSEGLSELATRSQDFLTRAGIAFESFDTKLFKHSINFNAFSEKEKANVGKYTNILSKGMRTIGQFLQEDPFSGSIMRLVREEDVLWEKLIVSADKGGKKLKTSIQSELARALDTTKREGINLNRLFKGTGKVPELQEIIGQLMELRKTKRAVDTEMMAPGVRPFSNLIKDASLLQGTLLTAFGSISKGLSRVGETGKVDIKMGNSIRNLDTVTQHLNILQAEIDETIAYAKKTGQTLPLEFQLVTRSVSDMGSSLNSSYEVLKKLPTHAKVSEKDMEKLAETVNKSASALKKFDQIDLKEFSSRVGTAMSIAMNKVNAFSKQAQIRPSFQLGKTGVDQILKATGSDSDKMIQQWRESAVAGGDTWKQMTMFLKELEPEMKGIFERFASKPRLLLKAFDKMTPQMRILMSLYFNEMGHSTAQGFQKWMQTYDKYFSGMTKTNKRHLETFLGYTSQTMASFKAPDVTKYFAPETGLEADKTTEGLKRLGNALSKLGINMKELKDLSGDTSWLKKWGEAFATPIDWDFGPGKGKTIQLTGTFSMFAKAITHVGEGLDILMTQLRRVGEETQSGAIQKGIKQLVALIMQLDAEFSKTSKFKLSIGAGLSTSLKPLRDVGYAINSFFDAMEKIKLASDFTLTQKEISSFGNIVIITMNQVAAAMSPAVKALTGFANTTAVKRFSQFAQGLRDLVAATKDLYQFTAVFSEIDKDSKKGATALGHFEKVMKSMMILLNSIPDISKKLNFGVSKDAANNARMLVEVLKPLAQSMLMIGEAFKGNVNIESNMKRFSSALKGMINVIRSVDLDPVTKDLLNDIRKLTQIFSSKALVATPDEAEKRLQVLAQVIEQGSNKVAQKTKQGIEKMNRASKTPKTDFLTDLGITPGKATGGGGIVSDLMDIQTSFSEPVPNFDASEQAMGHLASAGKEVGKVLQVINNAVIKLGSEFKEILPGEEKFITELTQLAALNPAAAIDKLNIKLNSLGKNLAGDNLKKSQDAIQGFIIELLNGAAGLKSMGAAGTELQKIHDNLNKDTVSTKELTIALTKVKGVLKSVEVESAKLDLQNRLLKTRGEAKGVHTEIKSLLMSMKALGPEFRKSLSTGDARREFLSYSNELGSKLETAMGPMRAFSGFKGVSEEIKKMTSSMAVLKSQSQGMVTLADRFTGKLRIAGDQFLNLVAYQTRWYVSQQIFFMGFGQIQKILSNFGALDIQVRRVLRVLRDSNNAVLGIDSSIRALSGAGVKWASDWAQNMEVMFKAQTRSTFYSLFKQLGTTSEEIGESMYQLGSAGLQANEVMSAIEPTLRMIIATEGEVKDTTRLIAGVFNLYGNSIEGARTNTEKFVYITDVLTATFRDHMVTIGELITGISYTIATAKLSGMQFEEVTAALAVLNDNMLKGSKAGRAFNRMLLNSTKRLDETKDILQAIGNQANIGVDLTKIFEGLEVSGARPFDYIIQAGIAMQEQLKTANLTVENLTRTFKSMGVVGARAFAILLLKAGDYEKTLFQLKYAAFSAGEDMSELLIGGFDRSIHRIEGFTRAGYARVMGIARGGVTVLASMVQQVESGIKRISEMPFIPDIPDVKSYISFFGVVATGAAIFAGIKKKPLPGLDALRFDKWAKGINKFTLNIDQNRTALKLLNVELRKTGLNAINLGQAYETAANKMTAMSKMGSTMSTFKGLTGLTSSFKPQQQLIISGLKDIERAYTKVTSGKWSMGDLTEFNSQMKSIAAFEPTFLAREKEFTIKTNLTRTISEFQRGSISADQFRDRLNAVHKETIKASGMSNLTTKLDIFEKELASGSMTMSQYTTKLRQLGIEANKLGSIKTFGLGAVSTKGFAESFKGMSKLNKLYSSNMDQMSKIGIKSMDQVFNLVRNPAAWSEFASNMTKSYSKFDSQTQKVSNQFGRLVDQISTPIRKVSIGISQDAMEKDFVKQTKSMSVLKESWKGFAGGVGLGTSKLTSWFKTMRKVMSGIVPQIGEFDSSFSKAVAKREALVKVAAGFRGIGGAARGAAIAVKGFLASTIALLALSVAVQKAFEWFEKLSRGTEYYAQILGTVNAEFNKTVASLTGNISGITRYVDKLSELRESMNMRLKIDADIETKEFNRDLSHLSGLLEGTFQFENFEFNVKYGTVTDAIVAWRDLNDVIANLKEETSNKAIGRFVELGNEYKKASEIYKNTITTALEGSWLKSRWDSFRGKEKSTSLKIKIEDLSDPDKVKFKRQGQEAAKLMIDSAKIVLQQGATTFDLVWDKNSIATFDRQLNNVFESTTLFGDSLKTTNLKFNVFIKRMKQSAKTAELFDQFKEVGENLNKVFQVGGAEEFATFMKMFPNLASESKDEVKGLADSWASLGEDERAVVLINAARKDLKLFHKSMKAVSADGSMLQAADSTKKFVEVAITDISMLNTSIAQMGGTLAREFESTWSRAWGQWVNEGVTASLDVDKALTGSFEYGSKSILGKLERDISKTTDPIVKSFTSAYTKVGSVWAKETSKMIKDNKLPKAFSNWGNELRVALTSPWAKARSAQDEWRSGMNNAVDAAMMRFNLLQESMSKMGSLVSEEWLRAQSAISNNTSFGSEKDGEDAIEKFTDGIEKSLKAAIKSGHKGIQDLAKAMSGDVSGAIDLTVKRMERLTNVIAQAKSLSIEVKDAISKWEGSIVLTNKVLSVTLDYLKKFAKNADISKTVRDMNVALLKNEKLRAKEAFERGKKLGVSDEDKLKGAKTYLERLDQINEKLMSSAVESLKKHISDKAKAEKKEMIERHKRENRAAKESQSLRKISYREEVKDAKIQAASIKKIEKLRWKRPGYKADVDQKIENEKMWGERSRDENRHNSEMSAQQKKFNDDATKARKERQAAELKTLEETGGKTAKSMQKLAEVLADIDSGELKIKSMDELLVHITSLGDPELTKNFKLYLDEIKNTNVEISSIGVEAKEVADRAEKSRLETKDALKSLVSLQEKLTKYSETVSKQSKVIADLLKREGLTQAIQALSAMGFNVKLDKEGVFKDDKTLGMFNKLIGEASEGLVDAANKLQAQVQPIKAFGKIPVEKEDVVSSISRQLLNLGKSFPEVSSHIDELSTQFIIQLDRMKASGKTQEEIDSRLGVVLSSITGISDDAKNLNPTSMSSYLDDITSMLKITSNDLKQIDISNIQPSTTKALLQEKIQPIASETTLKNIQKNQNKIDSFVSELPQWTEVADKVEEVAISSFEDVSQMAQNIFDAQKKKVQEGYLARDDFRLRDGKLQKRTAQADVVLGKMIPIDITKILDADTFQTKIGDAVVNLRLAFIDALESNQAGSTLQTEGIRNLVDEYKKSGYSIQAFFKEYDEKSNRLISTIYATKDGESIDINQEAIARGIAQVFVPKGIISTEDRNVIQGYGKIQEAAKEMSAGIHGFSQWLSTTYPNMTMQLPENFREIVGRGDEVDIRTILENESKLKVAFNEYLDKLGKSPIYTEEEMAVTDNAVNQLLKLGSTKGSIFVHDVHLDESIKNLFSAIKAPGVNYEIQQMPEINSEVSGNSIKNATVKLEESTFKVSELMQNLEGVFDQNFIKTLLDALPTTQDTTENLMSKLAQEFSDLRDVFVKGVQSIISAIISKQLVVNLPNNNEMANNIKKFTDQATEKGSIFTHDIHSESAIVDSAKQSKEGLSKVAKAQSETSVKVGNYIFELDKANDRIFPAATTGVFGVEGLAYEKFKALEFKIPDEDVKGLSEGIVNSMKQYAAQDKRRSETTLPSKDWSDQEYRSLKLTNAFDTVIPQLYDTVAELSKSVPESAYKEMISAVNDASMTLSNFSREKLGGNQSIVYDVLMEARNKINSISQQSQIQTKLQPDNTSSRVGLIQESSNFINSMSKVTDQFNEEFLINNKLLNTIKSTDLSGSMFDRDKIKNLSMEIVNGMILIKDSTTGIAHGFKTAEEAVAKIGDTTFNALKIKKREQKFEISNPQYEASFQNPYEQPITYEVQGAQEIDAKISDESIQIFRDILTGAVYASNVGFTGFTGSGAAAVERSREISNLMQGIEDTFGKGLTNALSNAFPSLGSQAQSSMVELSQKFTDLQTALSSKGSTEANSEVQSFLSYLEGLSNKMGEVQSKMTVPSEKYTAQIEMFSEALNTIKTKVADFTLEAPKEAEVLSEATDDASTEMVESVVPMSNATKNSTESINIFGSGLISSSANISEAISSAIFTINTAASNVRSGGVNMGLFQDGESEISMSEVADMVSQSLENFSSSLDNAAGGASDALEDMGDAADNAGNVLGGMSRFGARTGIVLPGYGGGDRIPFDLEPGEAVINKEAVRMFGRDLFNNYNQGKSATSMPSVGKRLTKVRSVVEKKLLNDDSPIRKFDINLAGVPFKGLATEDMINQLEKGLKRKQLVGQNI